MTQHLKAMATAELNDEQILWLIIKLRDLQNFMTQKGNNLNSLRLCGEILKTLEARLKELP